MTPEERITQLERTVADLSKRLNELGSPATVPHQVEKAFRYRLNIDDFKKIVYDYAGAAVSNTQAVNEAGSSSYNVLKAPDGYLFITIPAEDQDIVKLGIPYYNQ